MGDDILVASKILEVGVEGGMRLSEVFKKIPKNKITLQLKRFPRDPKGEKVKL